MPIPMQVAGRPPKFDPEAKARRIEGAMRKAAEQAMENSVTDDEAVREAMLRARDTVLAQEG